jgi:hypothetical protein
MTDKEALIERLATTCHGLDPVDPLRLLVDDVVAALREPEQEPVPTLEDLEQEIYQNTRNFISRDVMEWMLRRYYTHLPQRTEQEPDDIASIIACRDMLDAQPVPPKETT